MKSIKTYLTLVLLTFVTYTPTLAQICLVCGPGPSSNIEVSLSGPSIVNVGDVTTYTLQIEPDGFYNIEQTDFSFDSNYGVRQFNGFQRNALFVDIEWINVGTTVISAVVVVDGAIYSVNKDITINGLTTLDPPTGLSATSQANNVSLSWNSVSDATGYQIWRGNEVSGPFNQVGTVSVTTYNDSDLSYLSTYYYQVKAYTSSLVSDASTTVEVTTGDVAITSEPTGQNLNYVVTNIPKIEMSEIAGSSLFTADEMMQQINYFDGLGRPIQSVSTQASPTQKDIVQPIVYDEFGREAVKYLPYTSSENNGLFKPESIDAQLGFYTNPNDAVAYDAAPFAKTVFEPSPLSRVIKQGAPGADWQPDATNTYASTDHTVKMDYRFNATGEVTLWDYEEPSAGFPFGKVKRNAQQHYSPNTLLKNLTKDENGNEVIEYVDMQGKTLLKRVQAGTSTTVNDVNYASTYYIYDYKDQLVTVIPPEATKRLNAEYHSATDAAKNDFLNRWAFRYVYDGRNRMIEKKVPGAEPVYMVYDNRDRLVLTQDGNQRDPSTGSGVEWTFTKYDGLNRPVLTGIYTAALSREQAQQAVNSYYEALSGSKARFESRGTVVHEYNNASYPQVSNPSAYLTVTYYDDYNFGHASNYPFIAELGNATENMLVKGQVTGTKTKTIDGSDQWLEAVNYYDDRYRAIQSHVQTLKGVDRISTKYDFTGNVLEVKTRHNKYDELITWGDQVNVIAEGYSIRKANSTHGWNAGANSENFLKPDEDGWIEVKISQSGIERMFGFRNQSSGPSSTTYNYGFRIYTSTSMLYLRTPSGQINSGTGYAIGDRLRVEKKGNYVNYYKNGIRIHQLNFTPTVNQVAGVSLLSGSSKINFIRASFGTERSYSIERHFTYDHANRLLKTEHSINDAPFITLSENKYNELGELIDKQLHSEDNGQSFHQSVDYRYNIRGWLTRINDTALEDGEGDHFGMELGYNQDIGLNISTADRQFNGNISAVKWNSSVGDQQGYGYKYDPMNRITKGQSYLTASANAFNLDAIGYDLNGNFLNLTRKNKDGASMDVLGYTYKNGSSNQLTRVSDSAPSAIKAEGFKDGSNTGDDYDYDRNGNMKFDLNKDITSITYNYLNLPETVTKSNGDYIKYIYDAAGIKLAQEVYENGNPTPIKRTDYMGEFIYENDTLQLIQHEEGRIVPDELNGGLEYQYHLKDHLGNTRVTFTTKPKTIDYTLNYESNALDEDDEAFFDGLDNIISADIHDKVQTGESFNHQKVQNLNGASNKVIGSVLTIPVGMGDKINASVYAKYIDLAGSSNPTPAVGSLLLGAITGTTGTGTYEGAINSSYGTLGSMITNVFNGQVSQTEPMGFLNLLFLPDEAQSSIDVNHFSFKQIEQASNNAMALLSLDEYEAPDNGYIVVYVSNESGYQTDVYFDDMTITVNEHPVIQRDDYYPFGLTFNSWQRSATSKENKFLYNQGTGEKQFKTERVTDLDLNLDMTKYRMYDYTIGRFISIDPLADQAGQEVTTPYHYALSNPIRYNDPYGDCATCWAPIVAKYSVLMSTMTSKTSQSSGIRLLTNDYQSNQSNNRSDEPAKPANNVPMEKMADAKVVTDVTAKNTKTFANEVSKDGIAAANAIGTGLEVTGVAAPLGTAIVATASALDEGRQVAFEDKSIADAGTDLLVEGTINATFSGLGSAAKSTVKQTEAGKETFDKAVDDHSFGFSTFFNWVADKIFGTEEE